MGGIQLNLKGVDILPAVTAEIKSCCDNRSSVLPEASARRRAWLRRSWGGREDHWGLFLSCTERFPNNTFSDSASQL